MSTSEARSTGQALHSPGPRAEKADPDSDGDGLSDFQEVHKYRTDPNKKDTAGKGVSDGQWQQRREFTYSVRAVIRVMRPYNVKALNDDYQDVRVLTREQGIRRTGGRCLPVELQRRGDQGQPELEEATTPA